MNYFNYKDEFFVIDSDNIESVSSRLYGYSIQKSGIYDSDNIKEEYMDGLDGHGCYVYVGVTDDIITIQQDYIGSYGLYFYRDGDNYFAISNSFLRLVEYIKKKRTISLNEDYLNYFLCSHLESDSCFFTPINEIYIVDRNAIVCIDKKKKSLFVQRITPDDHKFQIDSEEGMRILDEWFAYWTDLFLELSKKTDFLSIDLSGGYDSRLSFILMLKSGVDLSNIRVNSINNNLHTYNEDYEIASQIAREYGFSLNGSFPANDFINYSLEDALNIELYSKMGFHKEPYLMERKYENKIYCVTGMGGEAVRSTRFDKDEQDFIEMMAAGVKIYPLKLSKELSDSYHRLMGKDFNILRNKYKDNNQLMYPLGHYVLRDTQCRTHFGKACLVHYFANSYRLTPLMDQKLWSLHLSTDETDDNNFLMALIYMRYCPELLDFPFEGNRYFLSPETVKYAKKINEKYPFNNSKKKPDKQYNICVKDESVREIKNDNKSLDSNSVISYMKTAFDSKYFKGLFLSCFDEQIYRRASKFYNNTKFFPIRHCYGCLTAGKMIESVIQSNMWLEKGKCLLEEKMTIGKISTDVYDIVEKFKDAFTARIDLEFIGLDKDSKLQEIIVSDDFARVEKPSWFQKNGDGYNIISISGDIYIKLKTNTAGKINVWLRGMDVRVPNDNSKRIVCWVDYTKFIVNENEILSESFPAWHNKSYKYSMEIESPGDISIRVCWETHKDNTIVNV